MALVTADRVRETTTVVGTGPATLLGAVTGFQSFAVVGAGNTCYYCVADQSGGNWEVGLGTYSSIGPTLTRTTVLSSSSGGSAVSFTAGTKDVFITYPAERFPALAVQAVGGTQTSGTVSFANSNGVSFGLNAGTMTASVATNYLTTAMQSGASSAFAGTGFTSATTAGTAIVATHNTAGLSMGIPAFLTTAGGGGGGGVGLGAGSQTATSGTVAFANSNGISFGMSGSSQITASYTVPTQSQQPMYYSAANGANSASTMVFANSNGVSFSSGTQGLYATVATNYLTTAMASGASSAFAGTGFTSASTAGVAIVATHNTAGLSMGVPAYITTYAAQTAQPVAYSAANGSANFSTLVFANSNGVSFSSGTQGLYATVATNYLTTAMASNYGSNFAGLGTTFAGTNVSASMTMGSAGLNLALSAGGGGGGGNVVSISGNTTGTANTYSSGTMVFAGGNNITLSQSGNTISILGAGVSGGQSQQPMYYSAANGSGSASTMVFADSNGVSFSTGTQGVYATVATNYQSQGPYLTTTTAPIVRDWQPVPMAASTMTSIASGSLFLCPLLPMVNVSFTAIEQLWSNGQASTATAAGWSKSMTFSYGLYSEGNGASNTQMGLMSSSSVGLSVTGSSNVSIAYTFGQGGTATNFSTAASGHSLWNGAKVMSLPFSGVITGGQRYFFAQYISTASAGFNPTATWSQMFNAEATNASVVGFAPNTVVASNKSQIQEPYGFILSVSTAAFPAVMAYSDMSIYSNYQPFLYFEG